MMLLRIIIFLFIFLFLTPFEVLSAPAKWRRPQYIKSYVPSDHINTKMVKEAFERWAKVSKGKIKFYFVHSPKIAQIRVNFVDIIPYDEWAVSSEERMVRRGRKIRSSIYIASSTYSGKKLSRDEIFTIMLHEVGHSLGVPHTQNKLSVMYPTVDVKQEILQSDIKKLHMLYNIK